LIGTDNLYWGRLTAPAFSTVDLCEELFAEKVIEAIAHVKKGGEPYCLAVPVRMVPRETVKDLS
jgi:DNA-binding LacI/PurR family transcriptional regulator